MVAAAIAFSQPGGGGVGAAGVAMRGVASLPVTVSNGNDAGVTSWTFEIVDVAPGSAVPTGIVQSGPTPTYTFTPDVSGSYEFLLTTSDGTTSAIDTRVFVVPETTGQLMPAFKETSAMDNYPLTVGHNARGWATPMEDWLRTLDTPMATLTSGPVTLSRSIGFVEFNGASGITATLPPAAKPTIGPLRRFYYFKNKTNQTNTITPAGADTIDGVATPITLVGVNAFAVLATDGVSNWDIIAGESDMTVGGDVTGPLLSTKVVAWENVPLDAVTMGTPSDTMVPQYNGLLSKWKAVLASTLVVAGIVHGSAQQIYVTNFGGTAGTWASVTGDISPAPLQDAHYSVVGWEGVSLDGTTMGTPANGAVPVYDNISGKWKASTTIPSGGISPGTAGQIYITNATPAASWTSLISVELTHGRFTAGGSGSDFKAVIGPLAGGETSWAAVAFLPTATAPSSTNYAVLGNGTDTYLNAPTGNANIANGGTASVVVSAASVIFSRPAQLQFAASITAPNIVQALATQDTTAPQDLTIQAQGPWASAVTNKKPGHTIIKTPTPLASANFYGGFMWARGDGSSGMRVGYYGGPDLTYTGIWFNDAGAPASNNFGFLGNQSFTYLNVPSGGTLALTVAGSASSGKSHTFTGGNTWQETTGSAIAAYILNVSAGYMAIETQSAFYVDAATIYMRDVAHNTTIAWGIVSAGASQMQIQAGVTSFSFNQLTAVADVATANITIAPQAPFATATGTNRKPGSLIVNLAIPTNSGTNEGRFEVRRNGVSLGTIKQYDGVANSAELILGYGLADSQYTLYNDASSQSHLNSPTTALYFEIGGSQKSFMSSNIYHFTTMNVLEFDKSLSTPTLYQQTPSTDVATQNLFINAQAPYASATAGHGTAGDVVVNTASSIVASGDTKRGGFQIQYGGTVAVRIGSWSNNTQGGIWFQDAGSPSVSNVGIFGDANNIQMNAPGTLGTLYLTVNNATYLGVGNASGLQLFSSSLSFGGGSGVLGVANATTTPTTNPSGGGILYADSGAGKWRGSSGTVTTFGPADLQGFKETSGHGHCPSCGTDFAHEWHNEKYGSLTVCMKCLTDEIGERPWIVRKAA